MCCWAWLSNRDSELGEILIWIVTQLNFSTGMQLVSLQGLVISPVGPSCPCVPVERCMEPPVAAGAVFGCLHLGEP